MATPGSAAWLDSIQEDIIDPGQRIIDPHHHLWRRPGWDYLLGDLRKDTGSGHKVEKTVFVECGAEYLSTGPEHLKPLGETKFVAGQAALSAQDSGSEIAAIIAHADLTLGDRLEQVLTAHADIAEGRFRGIRHAGAHAEHPEVLSIAGRAPAGLYQDPAFREGVALLGKQGYSYDTWHYHYQNQDFCALARAVPETTMILDHFGTPLGVGPYASQKQQIFEQWKQDIREISKCANVVAKLGGLAMPDNGFGWHTAPKPPGSDEFVAVQKPYYLHAIECFGPDRCMFESNFPVDKVSSSYTVLWNSFKRITEDFSDRDKAALFRDTAVGTYRL